jgi:hypothetical protein
MLGGIGAKLIERLRPIFYNFILIYPELDFHDLFPAPHQNTYKSSQVNTLPKAKSKTRSKQNKDMHKCCSVYSERGVPLPVFTSGGE